MADIKAKSLTVTGRLGHNGWIDTEGLRQQIERWLAHVEGTNPKTLIDCKFKMVFELIDTE